MSEHVQVVTTTDSATSAAELARSIVDAGLGACVQVAEVRSFYRWEGDVHDDPEWQLQVKTSAARLEAVIAHIREHHSYDVPEIIATPIVGGSQDYLGWVTEETAR